LIDIRAGDASGSPRVVLCSNSFSDERAQIIMKETTLLVFDVNETLLDLTYLDDLSIGTFENTQMNWRLPY
jgi:hypothetical protein